jgi:predicted cobalt transporter CbtA
MGYKLFSVVLISLALGFCGIAQAADKHGHDHDHAPAYGGIVAEAADLNYELVAKSDGLMLYVADHGKPVPTAGGKAMATVYAGSDKTQVTLESAGDNKFAAKGSFKVGVGVRVAVVVSLAGKPEAKLNFRLK